MLGEKYLGGLMSASLKRGEWYGGWAGYGVYATDQRLIGIRNRKYSLRWLGGITLGGLVAGVIEFVVFGGLPVGILAGACIGLIIGIAAERASTRPAPQTIEELELRKDFQVYRFEISLIEMKKPGLRFGHLNIVLKSGENIKIQIGYRNVFQAVRSLVLTFANFEPIVDFHEV